MGGQILYISGGARSGKSGYAQNLAEGLSAAPIYLATAQAFDSEMEQRIARHKADRGPCWRSHEEPLHLVQALQAHNQSDAVVLVDCLTLWLSNVMLSDLDVAEQVDHLLTYLQGQQATLIFVSNEVGMGIVPEHALARAFRDEAGRLNQSIARLSDAAYLLVSGLPLRLK